MSFWRKNQVRKNDKILLAYYNTSDPVILSEPEKHTQASLYKVSMFLHSYQKKNPPNFLSLLS